MTDYLQPVGRAWRIASAIACALAGIILMLFSLMLWANIVRGRSFHHDGKPLWVGATVVGLAGTGAVFISWRLLRHGEANGVTAIPAWFIQVVGVLMLLGLGILAYQRRSLVFIVEGLPVALAMLFVNRLVRARQKTGR